MPACRKYLKFSWRGVLHQFTALPIGLTSHPRIFTKVLRPVFATFRASYGYFCLGHIENFLYAEESIDLVGQATLTASELMVTLGLVPHPSKSVFELTQIIEFIRFM